VCLNYNAYGETISDLSFDPLELAQQMLPFADPLDFVRHSSAFGELCARYDDDMAKVEALTPARQMPGAVIVVLPEAPWARRVIGVLANKLAQAHADCAVAILQPKSDNTYTVSVRMPAHRNLRADEFCRRFPTRGAV